MSDTPVVLLNGARQTGKTTLAQALADRTGAQYFTLDDAATLGLVAGDPNGFIRNLKGPVVIDEIQKAPELFPAIKLAVDRDRQPGRFLLTGSANILTLPRLSESLAGRMEIIPLFPLSAGEIAAHAEGFIPKLIGEMLRIKWELGLSGSILIANPIPFNLEIPFSKMEVFIVEALKEAKIKNITGKNITPFLLQCIAKETGGESLEANISLVKNNAELGAKIAVSIC